MPKTKSSPYATRLEEALFHLERLIIMAKEWQTDWTALHPKRNGEPNPDFDLEYLQRITQHPEDIFDSRILDAEAFLKKHK